MALAQYQPMQMQAMPMAYPAQQQGQFYQQGLMTPMPAHQLQSAQVAQQFVPEQNALPAPSASFDHKDKAFTLHNIASENLLNLDMGGMPHTVMKNKAKPGNYRVEYIPQGNTHRVKASYAGVDIPGTPFNLIPRPVSIKHTPGEKLFSIENVHNQNDLGIHSKSLKYQVFKDKENETTYHVLHQPNGQTHDVEVTYKGKPVKDGQFRLAPKVTAEELERRMAAVTQGQMMHMQNLPDGSQVMVGGIPQQQSQQLFQQAVMTNAPPQLQATQGHQPMVPQMAAQMVPQMVPQQGFQPIMHHGAPPTFATPL